MIFADEIKALIIDSLEDKNTGGGDIDCLIKTKEQFIIIEFLRCVTVRPNFSHPNRYWSYDTPGIGNKKKFLALWGITTKTKSKLYLVNYEDSRKQFKIIEVLGLDEKRKIYDENSTKMNFEEFKNWFKIIVGVKQ